MKKIAIIGGGITGCISALYCSSLGFNVEIYERRNKLGGIISDIEDKNDFFFNGPQYYESNSWWIKELKKNPLFKKFFKDFNLNYGSYNDLFNKKQISNVFAQIVTTLKFKKIKNSNLEYYNDRINCYQKNVSNKIISWSNKYCKKTDILHHSCANHLNTGRIFFKKDHNKLKKLKEVDKFSDILLGVPNKKFRKNNFCIPDRGSRIFFEKILKFLEKKKIKVNFNSNIWVDREDKNINIILGKKKINADYYIWCSNPVPLIKASNNILLDNPVVDVNIVTTNIKLRKPLKNNLYIQTFCLKNNLFRIFIYKINKKTKLCLEIIFEKNQKLNNEINLAINVLKKFKIYVEKYSKLHQIRQIRHLVYSVKDFNQMKKFEKTKFSKKIFGGGWYLAGVEKKIDYIKNLVDKNAIK